MHFTRDNIYPGTCREWHIYNVYNKLDIMILNQKYDVHASSVLFNYPFHIFQCIRKLFYFYKF